MRISKRRGERRREQEKLGKCKKMMRRSRKRGIASAPKVGRVETTERAIVGFLKRRAIVTRMQLAR